VLRAVARRAGLSHVALSNARASLVEAGLFDEDGRPVESVSFEALAESWTSEVVAVAVAPERDNAETLGLRDDDPMVPGWALTDTLAAIARDAHITVTVTIPPTSTSRPDETSTARFMCWDTSMTSQPELRRSRSHRCRSRPIVVTTCPTRNGS
jgi:hypothetical protein